MKKLIAVLLAALLLTGCGSRAPEAGTVPETTQVPAQIEMEDSWVLIREEYSGVYDYAVDYGYDASGRLLRKTERENQITEYAYYDDGTLKQEILRIHDDRFHGNVRYSVDYRPDGTMEKRVDNAYGADGLQTGEEVILYDDHGNPTSSTWKVFNKVAGSDKTIVGSSWEITYDNTYDPEGRLTGCFMMNESTGDMEEHAWWYSAGGEVTHRKDYLTMGRLSYRETTVTDADGNLQSYVWESSDGYPKHKAEHCLYDGQGNLIYREYTENDITGADNMGTVSGSVTHYTNVYSKEGLLTQTLKTQSSYYYDGVTMETSQVPSHTSVLYGYDSEGRLISEQFRDVHGNEFYTNTWTYDADGNLVSREDIEAGTITCTYARLSTLTGN